MKTMGCLGVFSSLLGFSIFFAGVGRAEMDRWEVLAMRDRYAESNPQVLAKPSATASVPGATPLFSKGPTPSVPISKPAARIPIESANPAPTLVSQSSAGEEPRNIPVPTIKYDPHEKLAPTVENLRRAAHELAAKGLVYKFGSDEVDNGGLDCSATVQYLLSERLGIKGVPRTSYNQYDWLARNGTLNKLSGKRASDKLLRRLSPGDLIFWGKTWSSGHKVSHVMIYMGWNPENGKHYVFGARGKKVKGLTGAGVDVFELDPDRGALVGHGKVPGLQ